MNALPFFAAAKHNTYWAFFRRIPGYPRVDQNNSYLITRLDGAVLDAKPWVDSRQALCQHSTSDIKAQSVEKAAGECMWQHHVEVSPCLAICFAVSCCVVLLQKEGCAS